MNSVELLHLAVENNIAWCSAICANHGSHEITSLSSWANLDASPPFYPNIITRQTGAQTEVRKLITEVGTRNQFKNWGIKDSFCDLTLSDQGFQRILKGNWYGGFLPEGNTSTGWRNVSSPDELRAWENAWSGGEEGTVFTKALLSDRRIQFWFKGHADSMEAGFVSFDSGLSLGLSNWFPSNDRSLAEMGAILAVKSTARRRPIVCWAADDETLEGTGLSKLGPLQVWVFKTK